MGTSTLVVTPWGMADDRSVAAYVYDGGGLLESVTVGPNGDIHPVVTPWGWERR